MIQKMFHEKKSLSTINRLVMTLIFKTLILILLSSCFFTNKSSNEQNNNINFVQSYDSFNASLKYKDIRSYIRGDHYIYQFYNCKDSDYKILMYKKDTVIYQRGLNKYYLSPSDTTTNIQIPSWVFEYSKFVFFFQQKKLINSVYYKIKNVEIVVYTTSDHRSFTYLDSRQCNIKPGIGDFYSCGTTHMPNNRKRITLKALLKSYKIKIINNQ